MKKTSLLKLCGIACLAVGTQLAVANTSAPAATAVQNATPEAKAPEAKCSAEHKKATDGKCAAHKATDAKCGAKKTADAKCGAKHKATKHKKHHKAKHKAHHKAKKVEAATEPAPAQ